MSVRNTILLMVFGASISWIGYAFYLDGRRNDKIQTDLAKHDLAGFARDSIDDLYAVRAEISANSQAQMFETGPALTIGSMQTTFNLDAARLVPQIFKAFPEIERVDLVRIMTGTNSRGNEGQAKAIEIVFSRENSQTINWDKVAFSDLPSIADSFWSNPMLR